MDQFARSTLASQRLAAILCVTAACVVATAENEDVVQGTAARGGYEFSFKSSAQQRPRDYHLSYTVTNRPKRPPTPIRWAGYDARTIWLDSVLSRCADPEMCEQRAQTMFRSANAAPQHLRSLLGFGINSDQFRDSPDAVQVAPGLNGEGFGQQFGFSGFFDLPDEPVETSVELAAAFTSQISTRSNGTYVIAYTLDFAKAPVSRVEQFELFDSQSTAVGANAIVWRTLSLAPTRIAPQPFSVSVGSVARFEVDAGTARPRVASDALMVYINRQRVVTVQAPAYVPSAAPKQQ